MNKFEDNVTFEEILEKSFKDIQVGTTVTGRVIEINEHDEIFVDIGYKADGIIPKEEYSFNEKNKPQDEFNPGDKIKAVILKLNDGQGNVLMSYKKAKLKEIKEQFKAKVEKGEIFEEKVDKVSDKGLIVNYKGFIRIFIPLSLSNISREEDVKDYLNKEIKFKIIENEPKKIIGSVIYALI